MTEQAQEITGEQATAQLAARMSDSEFRTAYLAGSGPQVKEVHALLEAKVAGTGAGDRLEKIVAGTAEIPFMETTTGGEISTMALMDMAAALRERGLTDPAIKQAISGQRVSKAEFEQARILKSDLLGNPEWAARYLKGGAEERRKMLLINTIMANGYVGQEWRP